MIAIWPNGDWWDLEEGEPPSYKSDDYFTLELPEEGVECVEEFVIEYLESVDLGVACEKRSGLR